MVSPDSIMSPSNKHSVGSRLIQNTVSNIVGQVVVVLLTFFSTPYITRKMGASKYGAWTLLMTYLFSFSLLNLGINTSLVKYLAELLPKWRIREMQSYFSTSLTVLAGIGAAIGLGINLFAVPLVHTFFRGNPELIPGTTIALRIAGIAFLLQFLNQVMLSIPTALQRFEIVNLIRAVSELARIGAMVGLLYLGSDLPVLMTAVILLSLGTCIAYSVASKMLLPELSFRPCFSRSHLSSLLRHSRYIVLANAGSQMVSMADVSLIGYFLPVANVAYYSVPFLLAQRLWVFVANVVSVVFPAASSFSGAEEPWKVREVYLRGMKLCALAASFPAIALAIFSRPFLLYWLGADYAQKGSLVLMLSSIGFLINSFSYAPYQVLQGTQHARTAAKGMMAYMCLNLVLFVIFIPAMGIVGAAVGFLVSQLLFVPAFVGRANRLFGAKWATVLRVAYARPLLAAFAAGALCYALRFLVHSMFSLAIVVVAGAVLYLLLIPFFVLDGRERETCQFLFLRWTRSLQPIDVEAGIGQ